MLRLKILIIFFLRRYALKSKAWLALSGCMPSRSYISCH